MHPGLPVTTGPIRYDGSTSIRMTEAGVAWGFPTVLDRVIQQVIAQVLSPIFEATFSEYSYGFRPKRSQHQAVTQVQAYVAQGRKIAIDVDLSKFFDRVNQDFLMTQLGKKIRDKAVLKLIAQYLRAGVFEDG